MSSSTLGRFERRGLQHQAAGLDLGEVENVVDQLEQVAAAAQHVGDVALLALGERPGHGVLQQLENPMMALSGVRSSWLMFARKLLLARLARSAAFARLPLLDTSRRSVVSWYTAMSPMMFPA